MKQLKTKQNSILIVVGPVVRDGGGRAMSDGEEEKSKDAGRVLVRGGKVGT